MPSASMLKAQPMPERDTRAVFQRGIDLFNAEEFFECHEFLEEVWTLSQQPDRWFLQALIHFAVGFYHHGRGNRNGATRQLRKGLHKIQQYLPEWDGVSTGKIERQVRDRLQMIEGGQTFARYPRIDQTGPWPGLRSPLRT